MTSGQVWSAAVISGQGPIKHRRPVSPAAILPRRSNASKLVKFFRAGQISPPHDEPGGDRAERCQIGEAEPGQILPRRSNVSEPVKFVQAGQVLSRRPNTSELVRLEPLATNRKRPTADSLANLTAGHARPEG